MTGDEQLTYDRAAARIGQIMAAIAVVGTLAATLFGGWHWGAGFALGAMISGLNYAWLRKTVESLASADPPRRRGIVLGFRYLILGGIAYVILKLTPISLKAVFAGVFVLMAAVLIEVAVEIVYARK